MIYAALTLRITYDEASGTPEEVEEACKSAISGGIISLKMLTQGRLSIKDLKHEIAVASCKGKE